MSHLGDKGYDEGDSSGPVRGQALGRWQRSLTGLRRGLKTDVTCVNFDIICTHANLCMVPSPETHANLPFHPPWSSGERTIMILKPWGEISHQPGAGDKEVRGSPQGPYLLVCMGRSACPHRHQPAPLL